MYVFALCDNIANIPLLVQNSSIMYSHIHIRIITSGYDDCPEFETKISCMHFNKILKLKQNSGRCLTQIRLRKDCYFNLNGELYLSRCKL